MTLCVEWDVKLYYTVFKKVHPYDFHDNSVKWKPI